MNRFPTALLMLVCTVSICVLNTAVLTAQENVAIRDTPFLQEYHDAYPMQTPAENDVRALATDRLLRVWAATGDGVRCLENGKWRTPKGGDIGLTYTVYREAGGQIWIGSWKGIYRVSGDEIVPAGLEGMVVGAVRGRRENDGSETIFAAGPQGIWQRKGDSWTKIEGAWMTVIRAIQPTADNRLWVGTASGLYLLDLSKSPVASRRFSKPSEVLSSNINALYMNESKQLWVGSSGGMDVYDGTMHLRSLSVKQGLPSRYVRAIVHDSEGRVWTATKLGAIRYDGKRWTVRHSRRWVLSDDTRDVTIADDGTVWVATAAGVSAIRSKRMTLADKADHYLDILRSRHIRPSGLVAPAVLDKQGDLSNYYIIDDDNDGEHTGMYCALESMRYAVTKDPQARENAKQAFHALEQLQRITGTEHFIARSMLPIGTAPKNEVDRTFTPQEIADTSRTDPREKIIEKRWVPSADGKWLWKRDASSDEVDGHLFGYSTYYDLAADADEKKRVAAQVDRIVGGIVAHGYRLQDIDGIGTRWGNWSPDSLNHDQNWFEERGGNSVEMIAYLGIAYHMTGNPRYKAAAKELIEKHGYARNALLTHYDTPSEHTHIVDELLSIVYPGLMRHLIEPGLKANYQTSMRLWYKTCQPDGSPLYDFVYNRYSGSHSPLDAAVENLREWPLDLIEWTVDNSQREDVQRDTTPGLDEGSLTRLLPRSEIAICCWDQEPYRASMGSDGKREEKGTDWLIAYWMGRYYGFISAPERTEVKSAARK